MCVRVSGDQAGALQAVHGLLQQRPRLHQGKYERKRNPPCARSRKSERPGGITLSSLLSHTHTTTYTPLVSLSLSETFKHQKAGLLPPRPQHPHAHPHPLSLTSIHFIIHPFIHTHTNTTLGLLPPRDRQARAGGPAPNVLRHVRPERGQEGTRG